MDYLKEKTKDELLEIILKQAALNSDYVLTLLKYKQQEEQLREIMHSLKKDLAETRQELEELLDEVYEMESLGNVEEESDDADAKLSQGVFEGVLRFIADGAVVEREDGSNDYVPAKEMEKQIAVSFKSHYHFLQNGQRKIINKTDDLFDFSQFEILEFIQWETQDEDRLFFQIGCFLSKVYQVTIDTVKNIVYVSYRDGNPIFSLKGSRSAVLLAYKLKNDNARIHE